MILGEQIGKKVTWVAVSGGFDPLHQGHVEYFLKAKEQGDRLVVIVNTDEWLIRKKGYTFLPLEQRMFIIQNLAMVDKVVPALDEDGSVCESLEHLRPDVFAKGGDRFKGEVPETLTCERLGIKLVDGLGAKIESSSEMVKRCFLQILDRKGK